MAKVKKWIILEDELDVLTGELTPTYKVKRMYIHKKYESKIEQLYIEPKLWRHDRLSTYLCFSLIFYLKLAT